MDDIRPGSTFFRSYLVLALATAVLVIFTVGMAGQAIMRRSVTAEAKHDAENLARGIGSFELGGILARAATEGRLSIGAEEAADLSVRLQRYVDDFGLLELRLADRNGSVVFSTEPRVSSRIVSELEGLATVLRGTAVSQLREHGDTPLMVDLSLAHKQVVESAVPLRTRGGEVMGVLTVFADVDRFVGSGREAQAALLLSLIGILGLTCGIKTTLVRRMCTRMDHSGADLVRAREDIARSRDEMETVNDRLVAAEAEAQGMARRAKRADDAKTTFLANMSHEMRTPLTAILGYADLIADPVTPATVREDHLGSLRRNGMHLLTLIEDILDLAQIERGEMAATTAECPLLPFLDEIAARIQRSAEAKQLTFNLKYRTAVPAVCVTDAPRLRQALLKLLDNAVKYTHDGEVALEVEYTARSAAGTPALVFHVMDTGIGLPEEVRANPGQTFAQGNASPNREFGGTGMGLHIAASIADILGGHLCAYNRGDKGAHLVLSVASGTGPAPTLVRPAGFTPTPRSREETARLDGVRILYAEDGPDNQFLVRAILRKVGAEVDIAANGALALEMAAEKAYDLVLMDIQMPVMDGLEATRELRARGYGGPVLALTANAMDADRALSAEAGCDLHLTKPINRRALLEAIAESTAVTA